MSTSDLTSLNTEGAKTKVAMLQLRWSDEPIWRDLVELDSGLPAEDQLTWLEENWLEARTQIGITLGCEFRVHSYDMDW